ncbi:hypothetical protein NC652_025367 [Populus alba x Populus x berolinensis]|nr:hypothetical protein NC652_025367 [Populus alba x Populus x berolinensis]
MTLLTGIVEMGESVKSARENTIDCPAVNGAFTPVMAFLSSSTLEVSFPPVFPSSETR